MWHPIDPLPLATVVLGLHFLKETHETKTLMTPLSAFRSNQLQHTRSACFTFDSLLLSHAGQLSCCDVTEVT